MPTYLDDNGNPIESVYLDDSGNPVRQQVAPTAPAPLPAMAGFQHTSESPSATVDMVKGFVKGAGQTVSDLGGLLRMAIPDSIEQKMDQLVPPMQFSTTPSNETQQLGKYGERAAELALAAPSVVQGAKKVPGIMAKAAGISKPRAAANLTKAAEVAKDVVVNSDAAGQIGLRIAELKDAGHTGIPNVVNRFVNRITNPAKAPMTYKEARDFYSGLTKLSRNERGAMGGEVGYEVKRMARALNDAIKEAANTVGVGDTYTQGMTEYARASRVAKQAPKYAKMAATGVGAGMLYNTLQRLLTGK